MASPAQPNPKPLRNSKGQYLKGQSGGGHLDRDRARRQLNAETIQELHAAFRRGGRKAIDKVMKNNPAMFLKMLVLLVPREMEVMHSSVIKSMTDQQIEDAIAAIETMMAARNAKIIEHETAPKERAPRFNTRHRAITHGGTNMGRETREPD